MTHYTISDTGELYYLPEVPVEPKRENYGIGVFESMRYNQDFERYESALKSAKEKGIKVKNHNEVVLWLVEKERLNNTFGYTPEPDTIYSLDDSYKVEIVEEPEENSGIDGSGPPYSKVDFKQLAIVSVVNQKIK